MTPIEPHQKAILALIDCEQWKHSWHLQKTPSGEIDWASPTNHQEIGEIIARTEEAQREKQQIIDKATTALEIIMAIYRGDP